MLTTSSAADVYIQSENLRKELTVMARKKTQAIPKKYDFSAFGKLGGRPKAFNSPEEFAEELGVDEAMLLNPKNWENGILTIGNRHFRFNWTYTGEFYEEY